MKLCMIGVRGHYGYVLDGLQQLPQVQVVGISAGTDEDDPGDLVRWCSEHGHQPRLFDDYRKMLDDTEPDIVSIDGPFERHAEMCIEAFARGIHVFCEKPVATELEDLARVRQAYAACDVHLASMMGLRYDPAFYTAWQAVVEGAIGELRIISTRKSYRLGQRAPFYRSRESYGGTIPWVGSHAIDWIRWLSQRPFRTVYASHTTRANSEHGELEISALCHFTLADDVFASVSIDYLRPETAPTHGDDRLRAAGTEGIIEVRHGETFLCNGSQEGELKMEVGCERKIFPDFVAHVEGTTKALIDGEDALAVTEASLLARQSADQKRIVHFESEDSHE